jgi:hypothetical protein
MTNEQALDQAVMKLIPEIAIGGAGGRPNVAIVDALEEQLPELRRLRGEVWLEAQARTLKPRLPRGTLQRADLGDPAALALIAEREARWAAEGRDAHGRKKRPRRAGDRMKGHERKPPWQSRRALPRNVWPPRQPVNGNGTHRRAGELRRQSA